MSMRCICIAPLAREVTLELTDVYYKKVQSNSILCRNQLYSLSRLATVNQR